MTKNYQITMLDGNPQCFDDDSGVLRKCFKHVNFGGGGKGGGGSAPAPPDPVATANAQGAVNKEVAITEAALNRIDQVTPYGDLTFAPSGKSVDDVGAYNTALTQYNTDLGAYNTALAGTPASGGNQYSPGFFGNDPGLADQASQFTAAIPPNPNAIAPIQPNQADYQTAADPLKFTATQTLSEAEQRKLDLTNQAAFTYGETANTQLDALRGKLSQPLDYSGFGAAPEANEQTRQSVADSMYARMEPLMDRDRKRLDTRLATSGITEGSEAYNDAIDTNARARTDARLAIDSQALGQMGQLYGLEQSARDSQINELNQQRQIPLNELSAMLSGNQVQGPQFVNSPYTQIAAPDLQGATYASYAGQLNNYNQSVGQSNAAMGGLFGLGAAGLNAYAFG